MLFPNFKQLKQGAETVQEVVKYLSVDLVQSLRELRLGLNRITFDQNFESFEVEVTITTTESQIRNELPGGEIPTRFIITDVDNSAGRFNPKRGSTPWTPDFVYIENQFGTGLGKIRFFR